MGGPQQTLRVPAQLPVGSTAHSGAISLICRRVNPLMDGSVTFVVGPLVEMEPLSECEKLSYAGCPTSRIERIDRR